MGHARDPTPIRNGRDARCTQQFVATHVAAWQSSGDCSAFLAYLQHQAFAAPPHIGGRSHHATFSNRTDRPSMKGSITMLRKQMRTMALLVVLVIGALTIGLAQSAPVAGQATPDTEARIASAMSAGPAAIARDATILDNQVDSAGNLVVLRQGSNGWTCLPDIPATPQVDPMCIDQTWKVWLDALMAHKAPTITRVGIAYMLQGGSDASNTDPYATAPAAGDQWVNSPPHIMVLQPDKLDPHVIPTDPHNGGPWIMWAGTPYEHIMVPLSDVPNGS